MVSSPCCFCPGLLHHCSPPLALQRQASRSSVPRPRRNLLPPAVWMDLLSCASPAERVEDKSIFQVPQFHDYRTESMEICMTKKAAYSLTSTELDLGSSSSSLSSSSLKYTSTPLSLSSVFAFFVFFFFFGTWDSACFCQIHHNTYK